MRRSYYDPPDPPRPAQAGQDGPFRSEPYGPVPSQPGRILSLPPEDAPAGEGKKTPGAPGGARALRRFGALLALILLLAGTGMLLSRTRSVPELPDRREELWPERRPDRVWEDGMERTSLRRAPTGSGTALELSPAGEETLEPREIYERVSPSIVGIRAYLEDGVTLGSGVILSSDGYIITNAHVIAGADRASVVLSGEDSREALLVGYDAGTDLAVLKVEAQGLPAASFGDSSLLRVGDPAYAIGNPLGEELWGTMTDGIISAIDRSVDMDGRDMLLLQTSAALNMGSSGGALINAAGQVVGITNMKMMSDWETIEGLGFAVPTTMAKEVVDQILATGSYAGRPALGITVYTQLPTAEIPAGAYVASVERGSDAYAKGLRPGDVITGANGAPVASVQDLERAKAGLNVGDTLELTVWNERGQRSVTVKLVGQNQM